MGNKINSKGFSLIELSVGLAVLGLMIYTALAVFTERSAIDKIAVTNRKLDVIEDALRQFYLVPTNLDLPVPANPAAALVDADFGIEDTTPTAVGATYSGVPPTRSLNLPDDYMFDGWGNRFTYFVTQASTGGAMATGNMIVNDTTPLQITGAAVYVVISHGKNGFGAWRRNGGTTTAPTGLELENGNANTAFSEGFIRDDTLAGAAYFDDIVRWKTKEMVDYDAARYP